MNGNFNLDQCMKCSACMASCPVLAVNPAFPGPKRGGPDQERFRLKGPGYFDGSLKYCLNCKRCEVACPSGVLVGDIIQSAKIKNSPHIPKIRDAILASTDIVGTLSSLAAPIVNTSMRAKPVKVVLDAVLKIDRRRSFPKYSFETFRSWMKKNAARQSEFKKQVCYFHGCYVNYNNPQLGKDFVKLMNAFGVGIGLLEKESCCGVALISNGLVGQAKRNARKNLEAIRKSAKAFGIPVVSTSSTCALTMRNEYPHLLNVDNSDVRDDIETATRYLYRLISERKCEIPKFKGEKLRIAYHTPCHLEKLGWGCFSIGLLNLMPNAEITVLGSNCCGMSGTYGFKKENYEYSQQIGGPLFREIENGDFDLVASDCETCKWQIEMSTSKKCEHPVTVLANALA